MVPASIAELEMGSRSTIDMAKRRSTKKIRFAYEISVRSALIQYENNSVLVFDKLSGRFTQIQELSLYTLISASGNCFVILLTSCGLAFYVEESVPYGVISPETHYSLVRIETSYCNVPIVQVSAKTSGSWHDRKMSVLMVDKNGDVYGFEDDSTVKPGDVSNYMPKPRKITEGMRKVCAGFGYNAGVTRDGKAKIWGKKVDDGLNVVFDRPIVVPIKEEVSDVFAEDHFVLFHLRDNSLYGIGQCDQLNLKLQSFHDPVLLAKDIQSVYARCNESLYFQTLDNKFWIPVRRKIRWRFDLKLEEVDCSGCKSPCITMNLILARHCLEKNYLMAQPIIVDLGDDLELERQQQKQKQVQKGRLADQTRQSSLDVRAPEQPEQKYGPTTKVIVQQCSETKSYDKEIEDLRKEMRQVQEELKLMNNTREAVLKEGRQLKEMLEGLRDTMDIAMGDLEERVKKVEGCLQERTAVLNDE